MGGCRCRYPKVRLREKAAFPEPPSRLIRLPLFLDFSPLDSARRKRILILGVHAANPDTVRAADIVPSLAAGVLWTGQGDGYLES